MSVGDEIKQIQDMYFETLVSFDEFCKANDIRYSLMYGTLIGAIRHNDFIPWDDDIDVCMEREEYEKLISIPKDRLPQNHSLQKPIDDTQFFDFVTRYSCDTKTFFNKDRNEVASVAIDIFILDRAIDSKILFGIHVKRLLFQYILARGHMKHYKLPLGKYGKIIDMMIRPLQYAGKKKKLSGIIDEYDRISKEGESKTTVFFSNTTPPDLPCRFPKSCFDGYVEVQFRDRKFPAPAGYDTILRIIYGDYMTPPPMENRVPIHIVNEEK